MTDVKTAVVPAAGNGTRLWPLTELTPKPLLPVGGRAAIDYAVDECFEAGITKVVVICPPGRSIQSHFPRVCPAVLCSDNPGRREIKFVVQSRPLGLGHAVCLAAPYVAEPQFAVVLPDVLGLPGNWSLRDLVRSARPHSSYVSLHQPSGKDPHGLVSGLLTSSGEVDVRGAWEEAPCVSPAGESTWTFAGRYVLDSSILSVLDGLRPGARDEIQLSDAVGIMANASAVVGLVNERPMLDVGSKAGLSVASMLFALESSELHDDAIQILQDVGGVPALPRRATGQRLRTL